MKIPLFYAVRVVLVFIFWYHNNVLLSSMPGRTREIIFGGKGDSIPEPEKTRNTHAETSASGDLLE